VGNLAPLKQIAKVQAAGRIALAWLRRCHLGIGLAGALTLIFVYRITVIRSQVALGVDAGNYLATMRQLFGMDITDHGLPRPPLVGVALWPLVHLFGPLLATKLAAVGVSVLMGVPFYLLCSRFAGKKVAAVFSLLFVFSPRYMDALNWGFLTLVGVGLFTLSFYLIYELVTAPCLDRSRAFLLGLSSLALVAANRSSALIYVATALAFGTQLLMTGGHRRGRALRLVPAAVLVLLVSLPFLYTYVNVSSAVGKEAFLAAPRSPDDLKAGWIALRHFLAGEAAPVWASAAASGVAGAWALRRRTRTGFALLLTLALVPLSVSLLVVGEIAERAAYFLYVPLWLGVAVCADVLLRVAGQHRRGASGAAVCGLGALALVVGIAAWSGDTALRQAKDFYGFLGQEHVDVIEAADRLAPAGAGVVYPWPLGQWTEGLAGRRVVSARQVLLTGESVTTNGTAFVADAYSAPSVPMDPAVGVDNGTFKHLLYLDDELIQVECREGSISHLVALGDARLQRRATTYEGDAWVDRRTYELDGLEVAKEVRLTGQGEQVAVALRADCGMGGTATLLVPLQPALPSVPVAMGAQQAIFGFRGWNPFGSGWSASAQVDVASSTGDETVLAVASHPQQSGAIWQPAGETVAAVLVKSRSPQAEATLVFTVKGWPSGDAAGLRTFTAEDAIEANGITFAVVDREPSKPWFGDPLAVPVAAWLDQAPYFQRLLDDGRVAAYRVLPVAAIDDQASSSVRGE